MKTSQQIVNVHNTHINELKWKIKTKFNEKKNT